MAFGAADNPTRQLALRGGAEYTKRLVVPFLPHRVRLTAVARQRTLAA